MDQRVRKLAKLLIHYSLGLKKGMLFKITGEIVTLPLIEAAYDEALSVGAYPYTQITLSSTHESMLKNGNDDQLKYLSPMSGMEARKIDALLTIWGTENTRYLSSIPAKRQALMQSSRKKYIDTLFKRISDGSVQWVGTQFPTMADAQEADLSLSEYEDFVYKAGHLHMGDPVKHWKKIAKEQGRLKKILDRIDRLHIRAKDTDIKFRVKGRKWISCHGTENFPDGEIFTSPIENSAEGRIRFSFPSVYGGREVDDVTLTLKKGKVVKEHAEKNLNYLTEMLNMDRGARFVGEIAIGTNYDIKRFTRNILFDEKIGGTCHMAVGASIPEAGGKNKSALHWDMVCNLKDGGEIEADGSLIYSNGKFTI